MVVPGPRLGAGSLVASCCSENRSWQRRGLRLRCGRGFWLQLLTSGLSPAAGPREVAPGGRPVEAAARAEPRARVPSLSSFASTILLSRIPMPGLARSQDTQAGTLQQAELLEPRNPQCLGSRLQISLPQPHRAVVLTPRPLALPQLPPASPALTALPPPPSAHSLWALRTTAY